MGRMREIVRMSAMHSTARVLDGMIHVDISMPGYVLNKL